MTKAVSYYHNALEGEKADETALRTAELNYENAVTEIKNVGVALQNADRQTFEELNSRYKYPIRKNKEK